MDLIKIGMLFESQLKTQMTCSTKIIFSQFQALAKTKFVQEHRGIISYNLKCMERNFKNKISVRMIRRQIKILAAEKQLIVVSGEENKYYVYPVSDKKFVPIFMLFNSTPVEGTSLSQENTQDNKSSNSTDSRYKKGTLPLSGNLKQSDKADPPQYNETLSAAGNIILSVLLDKAAFNYRGTGEARVYPYQVKTIADDLHICKRTFKNTLRELINLKVIEAPTNTDFDNFSSVILKTGFFFTTEFFALYKKLVTVETSEKCQQIFRKRAHRISKNRIMRADNVNKKQDSQNNIQQRKTKYMAEQPRTEAADPLSRQNAYIPKSTSAAPNVCLAEMAKTACCKAQSYAAIENRFPTDINKVEIFGNATKTPGIFWSETDYITPEKWKKFVAYM